MTAILTKPYRALRHPPREALAYQLAYLVLATGAAFSAGVHGLGHVDTVLAFLSAVFSVAGGLAGWVSQFKGFWVLERGAIWLIWGGLFVRSVVLVMISDATVFEIAARVAAHLTVCALLVPRYQSITGADRDPHQ